MMSRQPAQAPMRAGALSGALAAIAASLCSLPLHSPHDGLANTLTITLPALATGLVAGALWRARLQGRLRPRVYAGVGAATIIVVAVTLALASTQVDRALSFGLPLAALTVAVTGLGTPLLADKGKALPWWLAAASLLVALAVGVALAGQGDQESGELQLPPRASAIHHAPEPLG